MASAPLVSIIIPMYNCEKYVDGLADMLSRQTLGDFEVLCVDDGSTDVTLEKVRSLCAADERWTSLVQDHAGAGAARNTGIEKARGTYLMFLDADDEYGENLLAELVSAAEELQADEVFCLFDEYNYKTNVRREGLGFNTGHFPDRTPVETAGIKDLYRRTPWWCPCVLYRKELVDRYDLRFSTSRVANDEFFMRAYTSASKTVVGLHSSLLTYRRYVNDRSLTSSRAQHTEDMISALFSLHVWLCEHGLYEQHKESFLSYLVNSIRYNGSFPYHTPYVEAVADALCNKGLFDHMSEKDFYTAYWKRYDTEKMRKKIADLKAQNPADEHEIEAWTNRLATIQGIEKTAKAEYGRKLDPRGFAERTLKSALAKLKARLR